MSLLLDHDAAVALRDFTPASNLVADGVPCYLCHGQLGGPAQEGYPIIFWKGAGDAISFHASCAADFTFRLGQDVQALKHEMNMHISFESKDGRRIGRS
jgi:hypothetical protein